LRLVKLANKKIDKGKKIREEKGKSKGLSPTRGKKPAKI